MRGQVRDLGLQQVGGYREPSFVRRRECVDCDWVSVETVRGPSE
ncbi:hypothetical protein [Kineosporia sp. A_224]|nr:hypothetical protein [Kineosporia sp. A_224]